MIFFNEEIDINIFKLREIYKGKRHCVVASYPLLEVIKYFSHKEVSIKLFYSQIFNTFEIQPSSYQYYSKISYYDFKKPERRWARDKNDLFSFIRDLKKCDLWPYISNKDFLIVNSLNTKKSSKELWAVLKEITG